MEEQKVYCPYCGPWNGHRDGMEMIEDTNECTTPGGRTFPEMFKYYCPGCGLNTPFQSSREKARAYALRRFPPIEQIKWERDTAIQQLRDDYGVGFGEKKLMPKPLTIEELKAARKPFLVWSEFLGRDELDSDVIERIGDGGTNLWGAKFRANRFYGYTWRCWREYPTDEERAAASWNGD